MGRYLTRATRHTATGYHGVQTQRGVWIGWNYGEHTEKGGGHGGEVTRSKVKLIGRRKIWGVDPPCSLRLDG
jgi:hypothetical protein